MLAALTIALATSAPAAPQVLSVQPLNLPENTVYGRLDDAGNVYYGFDASLRKPGESLAAVRLANGLDRTILSVPEDIDDFAYAQILDVTPNGQLSLAASADVVGFSTYRFSLADGLSLVTDQGFTDIALHDGRSVATRLFSEPSDTGFHIIDTDGSVTSVDAFEDAGLTRVYDANGAGVIVGEIGESNTTGSLNRAFRYTEADGYELLPDLPLDQDAARLINGAGDIVAQSSTFHRIGDTLILQEQAFIITGDTSEVIQIESLPGYGFENVSITAFNDSRAAIGYAHNIASNESREIIYTPDDGTVPLDEILLDLDLPNAYLLDLNNRGQLLVGYRDDDATQSEFAIIQLAGIPTPGTLTLIGIAAAANTRRRPAV